MQDNTHSYTRHKCFGGSYNYIISDLRDQLLVAGYSASLLQEGGGGVASPVMSMGGSIGLEKEGVVFEHIDGGAACLVDPLLHLVVLLG